ncbi:MAG TPA: response regulator [Polyangiaceae bacterium]|nr:response regulator [Polyangiaceae bacterium]
MPSFFDESVRHMLRHLAATYRVHHDACEEQLHELEQIVSALKRALAVGEGSASALELTARAERCLAELRERTDTMAVFAARSRDRRPLTQVVEAAEALATSTSKRARKLTLEVTKDAGEIPSIVDAAFSAHRLAAELSRMAENCTHALLRWYVDSVYVVVELYVADEDGPAASETPAVRIEMPTTDPLSSGIVPRVDGMRVLAVDDDPTIRKVVERCLRHGGHRVQTAANVDEAMSWVARAPFDAIVTDVDMPGGGGFELLRRLQGSHPILADRLTFLTGLVHDPLTRERLLASGRPHLGKPFEERALLAMVRDVATTPEALQRNGGHGVV